MPDPNKLETLAKAGYKIQPSCGICKHGAFRPGSDWGGCASIDYKHEKHVADSKPASIHRSGHCPRFELDPTKLADLQRSGFDRFMR